MEKKEKDAKNCMRKKRSLLEPHSIVNTQVRMDPNGKMPLKRPLESPVPREVLDDESTAVDLSQSLDASSKMKDKTREYTEKNRERNREHAKKTRQRKKEMIEGMKIRLLELQKEAGRLEQLIEESDTASILLGLGTKRSDDGNSSAPVSSSDSTDDLQENLQIPQGNIIDQLRQKVRAEAAQNIKEKNELLSTSAVTQHPEDDLVDDADDKYSSDEADEEGYCKAFAESEANKSNARSSDIKRERNRMHAKLTRDRKKLFTSHMQQTILSLEKRNQMLRNKIRGLSSTSSSGNTSDSAPTSSSEMVSHHCNGKKAQNFNGFSQSMIDSNRKYPSGGFNGQGKKNSYDNNNFSKSSSTIANSNSNSNSGGGTPSTLTMSSASSNSNFLQSLVASGGIPTGVIPVIPVQSTPNGPVSWVPTAAFPWGTFSSQFIPNNFVDSGSNYNNNKNNNSNNNGDTDHVDTDNNTRNNTNNNNNADIPLVVPALYPIMTSADGTVLTKNVPGLPPLSTNLVQSFYKFQNHNDNALLQQQLLLQGMIKDVTSSNNINNNSNNNINDNNSNNNEK